MAKHLEILEVFDASKLVKLHCVVGLLRGKNPCLSANIYDRCLRKTASPIMFSMIFQVGAEKKFFEKVNIMAIRNVLTIEQ